jgi:hypothetical protein
LAGGWVRTLPRIVLAVAVLAAVFLLSLWGIRPPAPKPASLSASEFSGARARALLAALVGDGVPHPVGSAANEAVRAKILQLLRQSGYQPEVQPGFACDEYGTCGAVKNVVARLEGAEPGQAVLLAAHYDSVPAGPGASDDGVGTATVLETARALKSLPKPRHSIIFLIDEGEEAGLLGARVFMDRHPWAKEVRAAVNVDSRGTAGPSLMFETGSANEWVIRLFAKSVRRPATSSVFYTVYKMLPNDTDFTIFKAAGAQGANFGFVGDAAHYHTPLDNLANASPASIQHCGDNALAMALALANTDLTNPPQRESSFFDVLGLWTLWWPISWTLQIAIAAALMLLGEIVWLFMKRGLVLREYLWGLLAWPVMIAAAAAVGFALQMIVHKAGATPVDWVAYPIPLQATFWALGLATVSSLGLVFGKQAGASGMWAGVWTWWGLFSLAIASQTPGMVYIMLVPTCVAALAGIAIATHRGEMDKLPLVAVVLPLAAAGIVGFEPLLMLYSGLGAPILAAIALFAALFFTPLAPLCGELQKVRGFTLIGLPSVAAATAILAAIVAILVPAYSAKAPEQVNIHYWQDGDSGKSEWVVQPGSGRLQEPIRVATNFHRVDKGPFPWSRRVVFIADAPSLPDLAAPTFTVLEATLTGEKRSYRALMRSERGAPDVAVFFPPGSGVESVRMEGEPLQPQGERERKWAYYDCPTMPAKGVELSFTLPAGKTVEVYTVDQTYGLPLDGMFLKKARPLTTTQFQDGDITMVSRRVKLLP